VVNAIGTDINIFSRSWQLLGAHWLLGLIEQLQIWSFFLLFTTAFVIFLRAGRFEGEAVGTASVCLL